MTILPRKPPIYNYDDDTITFDGTHDHWITLDLEDEDLALYYNWSILRNDDRIYLSRIERGVQYVLHRVILARKMGRDLTTNEYTDHIDGNTLNNRRSNLRIATPTQNSQNQKRPRHNKTGFKGVSFNKHTHKWKATIRANNRIIRLGEYNSPEDAHEAYKEAAKKYHGEFARFE